jgi:hypothetical protein
MKAVPEAAVGAVRETLRESGEPVSAGGMTFLQARTANEVLKAQERRVRLQRMKGELVDRAKAVAQVFKLAREERDALVNWPAREAAMMAAELEVDQHQLHTVLERQVREYLGELAEICHRGRLRLGAPAPAGELGAGRGGGASAAHRRGGEGPRPGHGAAAIGV